MKLAVFGGTGGTGQELVKQALQRGHSVVALLRNPSKLQTQHENLQAVQADIFNEETFTEHLTGCDAVLSCLGNTRDSKEIVVYSQSMPCIIKAMQTNKISRLVAITSWCTVSERGNPWIIEWIVKPFFIGKTLANMAIMEKYLSENCKDMNYTIVRPPGLSNKPVTDLEIKAVEGQHVPGASSQIPRADVARFMLDCLASETWSNKAVAIGH